MLYGEQGKIEVDLRKYANDAEQFAEAARLNANHGRPLTKYDKVHCTLRAESLGLSLDVLAECLSMRPEALGALNLNRTGKMDVAGKAQPVPLNRTIQHMAGHALTESQLEVNDKLSGMPQGFYAQQLILLLENGLINVEDVKLLDKLHRLHDLLETLLLAMAKTK